MKKIVLALLLCFGLSLHGQNTQLTGTLSPPGSTQAAFTGYLYLNLSQSASVLLTCQSGSTLALPNTQVVVPIINGVMQNPPAVWGADCLNPRVPYNVVIRDGIGNTLVSTQWYIQGNTFNIGTAPQVNASIPKFCGGLFVCNNISNTLFGQQTIQGLNTTAPLLAFNNQAGTLESDVNAYGQYEPPSGLGCPTNVPNPGALAWDSSAQEYCNYTSTGWVHLVGSGGSGLESFTSGNLNPLFTTALGSSPTISPALAFAITNAAQNTVLAGPASGGAGPYSFQTAPTISAANMINFPILNQNTHGNADTASALSSNPTQCGSGLFATGIQANGSANCSTPAGTATPSTTGLAFWNNTTPGWGTSYTTIGAGTVIVLSNAPTINALTITGGATFTGTTNGNIALGSVGVMPGSPAASTLLLTVPNSVTAYTLTLPGAVPATIGSVASTDTTGTQTWALLPTTQAVSGSLFLTGYNATTGAFSTGTPATGFPITIGGTSIAVNSTTTAITGLTIDGISPTTMAFLDATSSIQTQLNGKQASLVIVANTTVTVGSGVTFAANTCSSVAGVANTLSTISMANLTTGMTLTFTHISDIHAITGWSPGTSGQLYFDPEPSSAGVASYYVCNNTITNITTGGATTWNVSAK